MRIKHVIPWGIVFLLLSSWPTETLAQVQFGVQLSEVTSEGMSIGARVLVGSSYYRLSVLADYSPKGIGVEYYYGGDEFLPLTLTALLIHTNEDFLKPPRGRGRGTVAWYAGFGAQILYRRVNHTGGRGAALITATSVAIGCRIVVERSTTTPFLESRLNFKGYRILVLAGGVYF